MLSLTLAEEVDFTFNSDSTTFTTNVEWPI